MTKEIIIDNKPIKFKIWRSDISIKMWDSVELINGKTLEVSFYRKNQASYRFGGDDFIDLEQDCKSAVDAIKKAYKLVTQGVK